MKPYVIIVPAVLVVGGAGGWFAYNKLMSDPMGAAREAMSRGDSRTALIELRNIVRSNPDNAEAHFRLGSVQIQLGDALAAEKEFKATCPVSGGPAKEAHSVDYHGKKVYFCCPNCNHRAEIFGHGGARKEAEAMGSEFLGEIPLVLDIREAGDAGTPIAASAPDSPPAQAFAKVAARLWEKVGGGTAAAGPRIVIS